ncbi:MAG TPA: helix-turn-helix domain-containing protein, partial [Anaeromyxobacteraceae bacterium]|nr:helix-turn-helix domain-containing protein [Anaeromyxobacteraceae bacterium]
NVRELENALEFAVTVCRGQTLQPEDLPPEIIAGRPAGGPAESPSFGPDAAERAAIEGALEAHRWSRADAARALGLSRSTLWRRMRALRIA